MRASSLFNSENRLTLRDKLILAGVVLFSVGVYLGVSGLTYRIGFPLDDAWIHQTYARNLALHGEWAFISGKPSGGSTAPLWSALLAIGFWLRLAPYAWAYLLGAATLWSIAMLGETAVRRFVSSYRPRVPWVGAALALEWHLVWAAASGMETLLYALLATTVLVLVISGYRKYFVLGLLIGLSIWVRPDGITLLGPVALMLLWSQPTWSKRLRALGNLGISAGSVFAFYLLFNLFVAGSPWPNTFYAKQAEYAIYLQVPFLQRLGSEFLQALVGVGVALLPGVVLTIISAVRRRAWGVLTVVTWFVSYLFLYAWRLPVTYQHGRYVIPVMPIFFLLGLAGLVNFGLNHGPRWRWIVPVFWKTLTGIILIIFWVRGACAYAQDVAVIESEMVATAHWVAVNVPPDSLVAAHDIGALGYFGKHDLVDLAGLVSPDVIPFIRDEQEIATYLDKQKVDYLVTFPDWYPSLTLDLQPVFTTGAPFAPTLGEEKIAVYKWRGP